MIELFHLFIICIAFKYKKSNEFDYVFFFLNKKLNNKCDWQTLFYNFKSISIEEFMFGLELLIAVDISRSLNLMY